MPSAKEPANPKPPIEDAEEAQHHRRVLHDLIDMGTSVARHIHQQITAPAEPGEPPRAPLPDLVAAFDRVTRAVRRAILLARRIAQPLPQPRATTGPDRTAARKRIIREVEDAIQRERDGPAAKALGDELLDRLDSPDLEEEIDQRPTKDIIADICRDMGLEHIEGLNHPWKRRTPVDIQRLCTRAAQPPHPRPPGGPPAPAPDRPPGPVPRPVPRPAPA